MKRAAARAFTERRYLIGAVCALLLLAAGAWLYQSYFSQEARELREASAAFKTGRFVTAVRLVEPYAARGSAEAETWLAMA